MTPENGKKNKEKTEKDEKEITELKVEISEKDTTTETENQRNRRGGSLRKSRLTKPETSQSRDREKAKLVRHLKWRETLSVLTNIRKKTRVPTLSIPIWSVLEDIARAMRQLKKQTGRRKSKYLYLEMI